MCVQGTSLWQSFLLSVGPAFVYLLLCYVTKTDFQIRVAGFMSAIYALIMMAVIVGTTIQVAEDSWTSPNAIFLMLLFSIFIIAAVTHPQEFWCLVPGALYFLCIPSGYLLLLIYSLCNLNIVSWGTREVEKKKNTKKKPGETGQEKPVEVQKVSVQPKENQTGLLSQFTVKIFNPTKYTDMLKNFFRDWLGIDTANTNSVILKQILNSLERIEKLKNDEEVDGVDLGFLTTEDVAEHNERVDAFRRSQRQRHPITSSNSGNKPFGPKQSENLRCREKGLNFAKQVVDEHEPVYDKKRIELVNPAWIEHSCLNDSEIDYIDQNEINFFQKVIDKYLYPLVEDKAYQAKVARDLKSLRNNGCFAFFMINALWMVIIFHLQLVQFKVRDYIYVPIPRLNYEPLRFEPLGFTFLIFFASILLVQFISMLWHRYGTVLHLLASTDLKFCQRKFNINQMEVEDVVQTVKVLQQIKGFEDEDLPVVDLNDDKLYSNIDGLVLDQMLYSKPNKANSVYQSMQAQRQMSQQVYDTANQRIYDVYNNPGSVYIPIGNASSIQNMNNSSYYQVKFRQSKKDEHNKSLDGVFRRRWQALSQGKANQIKDKPNVKTDKLTYNQVNSNIISSQKSSVYNDTKDHIINIGDV